MLQKKLTTTRNVFLEMGIGKKKPEIRLGFEKEF